MDLLKKGGFFFFFFFFGGGEGGGGWWGVLLFFSGAPVSGRVGGNEKKNSLGARGGKKATRSICTFLLVLLGPLPSRPRERKGPRGKEKEKVGGTPRFRTSRFGVIERYSRAA